MKSKLKFILIPIVIIAIAVSVTIWLRSQEHRENGATLYLYGNVELRDAQLSFQEQEYLREVLVEEGDAVSSGEVLARLDTDRLEAQLTEAKALVKAQRAVVQRLQAGMRPQVIAQAEAEVLATRAEVENARIRLDRLQQTTRTGATTQQDIDDAKAVLNVSEAQLQVKKKALDLLQEGFRAEEIAEGEARLEAAEARIKLLDTRLRDTTLRSPAKGIVQSRVMEPGEMARPGQPVLVIALTEPKWIRAYLPEPMLGRIHTGMEVSIRSDSFPERAYTGTVSFISPQAEFTPKSVQTEDLRTQLVYEMRILVNDPNDELRLGMPVTIKLQAD